MSMNPSLHFKRCQEIQENCHTLLSKEAWSSSDFDEARILIYLCQTYGLPYDLYHPIEVKAALIPPHPARLI